MGLRFLEHLLILTHDPEATRDWFVENLGFRNGYHPEFGFPVYWLYIGEQDVIHIGKARYSNHQDTYLKTPTDGDKDFSAAGAMGSGRIDHLCLNCEGIEEFIDRLTQNGVEFSERKAHNSNLYQIFMREPINGIKVELNFAWEEAANMGRDKALEVEAAGFVKLAKTSAAQSLIGLFLNDQELKKKAKAYDEIAKDVKQAAVLGAGIMGGGIAYQSASKGTPILMKDINEHGIEQGLAEAASRHFGRCVACAHAFGELGAVQGRGGTGDAKVHDTFHRS